MARSAASCGSAHACWWPGGRWRSITHAPFVHEGALHGAMGGTA